MALVLCLSVSAALAEVPVVISCLRQEVEHPPVLSAPDPFPDNPGPHRAAPGRTGPHRAAPGRKENATTGGALRGRALRWMEVTEGLLAVADLPAATGALIFGVAMAGFMALAAWGYDPARGMMRRRW